MLPRVSSHEDIGVQRKSRQARATRFVRIDDRGGRAKAPHRMAGPRTSGQKLLDRGRRIAGQERHLLGHRIGRARLLGQASPSTQALLDSRAHLLRDLGNLLVCRRRQRMKHRRRLRRGTRIHTVQHERVQMKIQIQMSPIPETNWSCSTTS